MSDKFTIEECDLKEDRDYASITQVCYSEIADHILTNGLGRFDSLKISFNTSKEATNAMQSFYYYKKNAKTVIGRFLSDNHVQITVRGAKLYFIALGGIKVKPKQG